MGRQARRRAIPFTSHCGSPKKCMKDQKLEIVKSNAGAIGRANMPVIDIETLINKAVDSKAAVEVVKELRAMLREDQ